MYLYTIIMHKEVLFHVMKFMKNMLACLAIKTSFYVHMISKKPIFRKYTFIHFWRTTILICMLINMKKSELKCEFFHNKIENPPKTHFKQGQNSLIKFYMWQLNTVKLWCAYASSLVLTRTHMKLHIIQRFLLMLIR
jgi:hypothetical protein